MRFKRFNKGILLLVVLLILCIIMIVALDGRIRILINNYAHSKAKIISNSVINDTVYDYLNQKGIKYTDLMNINTKEDGTVTSVEFDSIEMTKLKSGILSLVQNNISSKETITMNIPFGTLTGNQLLNNRGPKIKINMKISSAVYSKIKSEFISAGINQTMHRITMSISTDIYFIMPWYRSSGSYETEFVLAETVIVGEVPDAYTNVIEYPGSNIAGEIFDYSAQ